MPSDQLDQEPEPRPRASARNRRRMPRVPEEQEESLPRGTRRWPRQNNARWVTGWSDHPNHRRTRRVSPLTMLVNNRYNTNFASVAMNNHLNRNRENEFGDYDCCPQCYFSELMLLCNICNLPTQESGISVAEKEEAVPPEDRVRPLQAYVNATDEFIKELLAKIAERDMAME